MLSKTLFGKALVAMIAICFLSLNALAVGFERSFHSVPQSVLIAGFAQYANQGFGLQTLCAYRSNNQILMAGSFQSRMIEGWHARTGMSASQFNASVNTYGAEGYRPREISAVVQGATPQFSAIWKKLKGESFFVFINLTDSELNSKWANLVEANGFRVEDHISYYIGEQRRHAVIYVKDGKLFFMHYGMSLQAFNQKFQQFAAQGIFPTSLSAASLGDAESFSAVWMKAEGATAAYVDMTAADYKAQFDRYESLGMRFHKIIGYRNGTRFGAIWVK